MMLEPNCGYFNEEKDDEYAPPYGECEECYRYDICRRAKTLEELLSGKMVKLNFSDLSKFILDFPDKINTLMIQKTFDGYCIVVDDISVRREQEKGNKNEVLKRSDNMLDKKYVLGWEDIEHDLYEEDGKIFGVELDLFNGHENYYCKTVEDGIEHYQYLKGDIYKAIEQFNALL